jgi:hypothetical protein
VTVAGVPFGYYYTTLAVLFKNSLGEFLNNPATFFSAGYPAVFAL